MKICSPLHFQLPLKISLHLKKRSKVIEYQRGRLSALSPMQIFIVMFFKVRVVYIVNIHIIPFSSFNVVRTTSLFHTITILKLVLSSKLVFYSRLRVDSISDLAPSISTFNMYKKHSVIK